jgi:pimeloyl-ACP methyl ester carboxylesterase
MATGGLRSGNRLARRAVVAWRRAQPVRARVEVGRTSGTRRSLAAARAPVVRQTPQMPDVEAHGYVTHYELDDFTPAWRPGEPLVIQHGLGRSGSFWSGRVPLLAGEYQVIRRDLRGHGRSADPGPDYRWSLEDLMRDLEGFLDALELDRVHLLGESTGGMLAVAFAVRRPERLRSLTLCSTPRTIGPAAQQFFAFGHADWQTAFRELGSEGWARALASQAGTVPQHEADYREWAIREMGRTPVHVLEGYSRVVSELDVTPLLPQVAAPTLILAPTHSAATPLSEQVELRDAIPGARFAAVEAPSHEIYVDEPVQCTEALRLFLRSLP